MIQDINRLYRDIAADKGINFEIIVGQDVPATLETDSQRLQQVLRNLLTNAFKFTHQGTVSLSITRPPQALTNDLGIDASNALAFVVSDEGIGIARDKQAAIFQAFQQADGSTSRNYGGTGLGLSISRELARLLQGAIYLESDEGKVAPLRLFYLNFIKIMLNMLMCLKKSIYRLQQVVKTLPSLNLLLQNWWFVRGSCTAQMPAPVVSIPVQKKLLRRRE